ncbi:hypothetical protein OIV83_002600 [Microbotryomycetes sp. JL201]|nr:hypothetical protein OIV83_002600 [Microbotryomycetes sp. JL201]
MAVAGPSHSQHAATNNGSSDVKLINGMEAIGQTPRPPSSTPPLQFWLNKVTLDDSEVYFEGKRSFEFGEHCGQAVLMGSARLRASFSTDKITIEYVSVNATYERIKSGNQVIIERRTPELGSIVHMVVSANTTAGTRTFVLDFDTSGAHFNRERFEKVKTGIVAWQTRLQFALEISPVVAIPRHGSDVIPTNLGKNRRAPKKRRRKSQKDTSSSEEDSSNAVGDALVAPVMRPASVKKQTFGVMVPVRANANPQDISQQVDGEEGEQSSSRHSPSPELLGPERAARDVKLGPVQAYQPPVYASAGAQSIIANADMEYLAERIQNKRETLQVLREWQAELVERELEQETTWNAARMRLEEASQYFAQAQGRLDHTKLLRAKAEKSIKTTEKDILFDEKRLRHREGSAPASRSGIPTSALHDVRPGAPHNASGTI